MKLLIACFFVLQMSLWAEDNKPGGSPPMPPKIGPGDVVPSTPVDPMMLIWPEFKGGNGPGDPAMIPSERFIKKVEEAAEVHKPIGKVMNALQNLMEVVSETARQHVKKTSKKMGKVKKPHKSPRKIKKFQNQRLGRLLLSMSERELIPPVFLQDSDSDFWDVKFSFSYNVNAPYMDTLKTLSQLCGFKFHPQGNWFVLTPQAPKAALHPKISLRFEKQPLNLALAAVSGKSGINLVVPDGLDKILVSMSLKNVDPLDALEAMVKANNLQLIEMGDIFVIKHRKKAAHKKMIQKFLHKDDGKKAQGPHRWFKKFVRPDGTHKEIEIEEIIKTK